MRYRLRFFYSKGAFLVLLWISLESLASWSLYRSYILLYSGLHPGWFSQIAILPLVPFLAFAPLAGWLADSKFGNFKVFKFGAVVLLLSVLISSMCTILITNVNSWASVLSSAVVPIAYTLWLVGLTACLVTALQLGLDQMPDASTINKISFINWFFFSVILGFWVYDSLWNLLNSCTVSDSLKRVITQVLSLLLVLSMSIVCCTIFLLAPKWLIVEPKSSQALKTIYQVLKFAAKHKAPLNRSALTYWEEDMPSRLDLGKSRFGGPFTTEQVEDVKTFFKIVVIHLPWFIFTLPIQWNLLFHHQTVAGLENCQSTILYCFTYSPFWCLMLTT